MPKPHIEPTTQLLPVGITDPQRLELATEIGQLHKDRGEVEAERKLNNDTFKTELAKLDARIDEIAELLRDGQETKAVECELVFDFDASRVLTIRTDTGERIGDRPMTTADRQQWLFEDEDASS